MQEEFFRMIRDVVQTPQFQQMKQYRHHIRGSAYDHSVGLAYLCYQHYRRHGAAVPLHQLLRGALLHDFYLYDRKNKAEAVRFHGFVHPRRALQNARRYYGPLSAAEEDMILHHMFPLTPVPPCTSAGWLICFYDKVAAVRDLLGLTARPPKSSAVPRDIPIRTHGMKAR